MRQPNCLLISPFITYFFVLGFIGLCGCKTDLPSETLGKQVDSLRMDFNQEYTTYINLLATKPEKWEISAAEVFAALREKVTNQQFKLLWNAKANLPFNQQQALVQLQYLASEWGQAETNEISNLLSAQQKMLDTLNHQQFRLFGREYTGQALDSLLQNSNALSVRRNAWNALASTGTQQMAFLEDWKKKKNKLSIQAGFPDFFAQRAKTYNLEPAALREINLKWLAACNSAYAQLTAWATIELAKRYNQAIPQELPEDWLPGPVTTQWDELMVNLGVFATGENKTQATFTTMIAQVDTDLSSTPYPEFTTNFLNHFWQRPWQWKAPSQKVTDSLMVLLAKMQLQKLQAKGIRLVDLKSPTFSTAWASAELANIEAIHSDTTDNSLRLALRYLPYFVHNCLLTEMAYQVYSAPEVSADYLEAWTRLKAKHLKTALPTYANSPFPLLMEPLQSWDVNIGILIAFEVWEKTGALAQNNKQVPPALILQNLAYRTTWETWQEASQEALGHDVSVSPMLNYFQPILDSLSTTALVSP